MHQGLINFITSGMHYGWPSPSLLKLESNESTIQITSDQASWMAIMVLIGSIAGSLIATTILDIFGRKWTVILTSFPYFVSWIMIAYAKSVTLIYLARFIAGIMDGWMFPAGAMYVGEIAHPSIRGRLGSAISLLWILGILLINVVGSYLDIKTAALVSSAVPIACLLLFLPMPESAYFHILRNNITAARKSLRAFRGTDDVEEELTDITQIIKIQTENSGKFLDLFTSKSNLQAAIIIMIARGIGQLSGSTAINFYFQTFFKEAGVSVISPIGAAILYYGIQFIVCAFSSGVVDKIGRRPLLLISVIGSGLALTIEGTYFLLKDFYKVDISQFSLIPIIALILYTVLFSLGLQPIPIIMLGELFPANVKAFALSMADIYFDVVASVTSKIFQITKDNFGMYVPFYMFVLACVFSLALVYFYIPETKGKSLEAIQEILKSKKSRTIIAA